MRIAPKARTSSADQCQNPDTQPFALREHCARMRRDIALEYVDIALARDLHNRGTTITGRRCLLAAAAGRLGKSLNPVWYDRQAVQA